MVPTAFAAIEPAKGDPAQTFGVETAKGLLLKVPMVVAKEAVLVVDSGSVPALYLASGRSGYVTINATRSKLTFQGRPGRPVVVESYDPDAHGPDTNHADGRAYILTRSGELVMRNARMSWLGFHAFGNTSGVAWHGIARDPATGSATDTVFSHNYFGAYSADADKLLILRSSFLDNVVYGFDPHTSTDEAVVDRSVAARNGRHGFIFSEGCMRNVIRDSTSYLNGGDGFVIDDGSPLHGQGRPSSHNTVINVSAHDNGGAGVAFEGGTGNTLQRSVVHNNTYGVFVRLHADQTRLIGNRISATKTSAITLGSGVGTTFVTDNTIVGAQRAFNDPAARAVQSGNIVSGVRSSPASPASPGADGGAPMWLVAMHRVLVVAWASIVVVPLVARMHRMRRQAEPRRWRGRTEATSGA
jgi:hypothetical protein